MADTESGATPPCCPSDSHGSASAPEGYVNKGKEVKLGEGGKLTAYVVRASEPTNRAILALHDIFGLDSGRTKQICDEYAAKGYNVVMPLLLQNEAFDDATPTKGIQAILQLPKMLLWLRKNKWDVVGPLLEDITIPYMQSELKAERIGMICFCWGCYPMMHLLAAKRPELTCGVGFHPSLQVFVGLLDFGRNNLLKSIETPIMFLSAASDPSDIKPGGLMEGFIQSKPCAADCVFELYPDMIHGWVNRGDLSDAKIKRDYEDAIAQADAFLATHV